MAATFPIRLLTGGTVHATADDFVVSRLFVQISAQTSIILPDENIPSGQFIKVLNYSPTSGLPIWPPTGRTINGEVVSPFTAIGSSAGDPLRPHAATVISDGTNYIMERSESGNVFIAEASQQFRFPIFGTGRTLTAFSAGTAGDILRSRGAGVNPAWGAPSPVEHRTGNVNVELDDFAASRTFVMTPVSLAFVNLPTTAPPNGQFVIIFNMGTGGSGINVTALNTLPVNDNITNAFNIPVASFAGATNNRPNAAMVISSGDGYYTVPFFGNPNVINGAVVPNNARLLSTNSSRQLVAGALTVSPLSVSSDLGFPVTAAHFAASQSMTTNNCALFNLPSAADVPNGEFIFIQNTGGPASVVRAPDGQNISQLGGNAQSVTLQNGQGGMFTVRGNSLYGFLPMFQTSAGFPVGPTVTPSNVVYDITAADFANSRVLRRNGGALGNYRVPAIAPPNGQHVIVMNTTTHTSILIERNGRQLNGGDWDVTIWPNSSSSENRQSAMMIVSDGTNYVTLPMLGNPRVPVNLLEPATTNRTLDNANRQQTWQWSFSGSGSQQGMVFSESTPSTNTSPNSSLVRISADGTVKPLRVSTNGDTRGMEVTTAGDVQLFGASRLRLPQLPSASFLETDAQGNLVAGTHLAPHFPVTIQATQPYTFTVDDFAESKIFVWRVGLATFNLPTAIPPNGQCVGVVNIGGQFVTIARSGTIQLNNGDNNFVIGPSVSNSRPNCVLIVSTGEGYYTLPFTGNQNWIGGSAVPTNVGFAGTNATGAIIASTANLPLNRISGGTGVVNAIHGDSTVNWNFDPRSSTSGFVVRENAINSTTEGVTVFRVLTHHASLTSPFSALVSANGFRIAPNTGDVELAGTAKLRLPQLPSASFLETDAEGNVVAGEHLDTAPHFPVEVFGVGTVGREITADDFANTRVLVRSGTSSATFTLPVEAPPNGQSVMLLNTATQNLSIARNASSAANTCLINGSSVSVTLPFVSVGLHQRTNGILIVSDGTNFFTLPMFGSSNVINNTIVPTGAGFVGTNANGGLIASTANLPLNQLGNPSGSHTLTITHPNRQEWLFNLSAAVANTDGGLIFREAQAGSSWSRMIQIIAASGAGARNLFYIQGTAGGNTTLTVGSDASLTMNNTHVIMSGAGAIYPMSSAARIAATSFIPAGDSSNAAGVNTRIIPRWPDAPGAMLRYNGTALEWRDTLPLSTLTGATAPNTIDNGEHGQVWGFSPAGYGHYGLVLQEGTAVLPAGTGAILTLMGSTVSPLVVRSRFNNGQLWVQGDGILNSQGVAGVVFSALRDATSANDINLGGNQQTWRFNLNGKLGSDSGLMLKGSPTGAGGNYTPILRIEAGSNAIGAEVLALLTGRYGGNAWMRFNSDAELEVGGSSIKPVLAGARIVATNLIPAGTASGATAANSIPAFPAAPGSFLRYRGTAYTWEQPIWNELVAPIDNRDFAMGAYRTTFAFTGINGNAFVVSETNSTANGRLTNISSNSATVIPLTVSTTSSLRGFDVAPTSGDVRARYGARFSGPLRLTATPTTNEFGMPMIKLPILGTDEDGNIIEGQRQAFPVTILTLGNTQITVPDFDDSHMFVRTVSSPATVTLPVTMPRNGLVIIVLNLGTQYLTVARGNATHFINNAQHDYVIGPAAGTPANRPNGIFIVSDGGSGFFTMPFDGNATWINGANVAFGADFLSSNDQGQLVRATATLPQSRITGFPVNAGVLATNAQGQIVEGTHEPSAPNLPITILPLTGTIPINANDFAMARMFVRTSGSTAVLSLPTAAPFNGECIVVMNASPTVMSVSVPGVQQVNGQTASVINIAAANSTATRPNGVLIVSNGTNYFTSPLFSNPDTINGDNPPANAAFIGTNAQRQIINSTANLPWNRLGTGSLTTDWRYVAGTAVIAPSGTGRIAANNLGDASALQPIPAFATGYLHYNGTALEWVTPTGGGDGVVFHHISETNGTVNITGTGGLVVNHNLRLPITNATALGTDEDGYIVARAGGNGGTTFAHLHENTDTETIEITGAGGLVASNDITSGTQVTAPRFTVNPNPVTPEEIAARAGITPLNDPTEHTSAFRVLSPDSLNWLDINVPDEGFGDPMLTSSTGRIVAPISAPVAFPVEYLT